MINAGFVVSNDLIQKALKRQTAPALPIVPPDFQICIPLVEKYLSGDSAGHDKAHVLRVLNLALRIQKIEGGDQQVIGMAALLHDLLRPWELEQKKNGVPKDQIESHFGLEALNKIRLEMLGVGIDQETIVQVLDVIAKHERFEKSDELASIELRVLQDADRLDAIGVMGLARTLMFGGAYNNELIKPGEILVQTGYIESPATKDGSVVKHIYEKLIGLADSMNTKTAMTIAQERKRSMVAFVALLFEEMTGAA